MKSLREGENFRGILNDLKRRPEDAARELNCPVNVINAILEGEMLIPPSLIEKAEEIWPVSVRDFHLLKDDAPQGVKIMTAGESEKSSRIMERAGKPYYEYRDTATTRNAFFRPEWIKELCVVDNNDPTNSKAKWNNGHFMHQFTFFIGPVNFYYRDENGKKQVAVMDTGDSMYITPFVPHTFTTRKNPEGRFGLILALTYGNKLVGDAQQELSAIGRGLAEKFVLDVSTPERRFSSLLRFYMGAGSISLAELEARSSIARSDIGKQRLQGYLNGKLIPPPDIIDILATALGINAAVLLPPTTIERKVIIQEYRDARSWHFPNENSYQLVELAHTRDLPNSRALELNILGRTPSVLETGLHQYGYNIGPRWVELEWVNNGTHSTEVISPGDSFYMKPFMPHRYLGQGGKLLILRIGGRVVGEPQIELSNLGKEDALRSIGEKGLWFNPEGRNRI